MSIIGDIRPLVDQLERPLPVAYGGCGCMCHRVPGVYHCMPCCYPSERDSIGLDQLGPPIELSPVVLDLIRIMTPNKIAELILDISDPYRQGYDSDKGFYGNPYLDVKGKETEMRRWIDGKVQRIIDDRENGET